MSERHVPHNRRHHLKTLAALGAAAACTAPALAQSTWPTKPVKVIIPFPPGQATDIFGRAFAERLAQV
jgi:tripartite-type tricarboxylate transporter receptor subunit TctC